MNDGLFESARSDMHTSIRRTVEMLNEYGPQYRRWRVAWSGGKDSTAVVTLIAWLISSGKVAGPVGGLEVLYADTRLELPPLWLAAQDIRAELEARGIPVRVVVAPMDKRFMVYILGRGVPPPNNTTFRWCTRQIKVEPMKDLIGTMGASPADPVLMLTGVRLGESAARDARIALSCSTKGGTECGAAQYQALSDSTGDSGPRFFQREGKNGIATLAPIIHWRICHVWSWLSHWAPEEQYGDWDTAQLAAAYGGRDGDEAQEIGARTGCTGCPLASQDTALDAILRLPQWAYLQPLKGLRPVWRWLREPQNRLRQPTAERCADGRLSANAQRLGPATFVARLEALRRILEIQSSINADAARLGRPQIDILNAGETARIRELISAGVWPDGWTGQEPTGDVLLPGEWVVDDRDDTGRPIQRVIVQNLLFA